MDPGLFYSVQVSGCQFLPSHSVPLNPASVTSVFCLCLLVGRGPGRAARAFCFMHLESPLTPAREAG